jgi:HSP20 family protein
MISEEFFLGSYFRQFRLSDEVDQSKIKASLDQGALTIDLPKAEKAKPKRIDVELDELYFRVTRQDRSCYAAFTW